MGFSNGISEPIVIPAPEWDADEAYERSLMDEPLMEIPPRYVEEDAEVVTERRSVLEAQIRYEEKRHGKR